MAHVPDSALVRSSRHTLTLAVAGDSPPSEFRIFAAGVVSTTKGDFTFDAASAASVLAEYKAHGIDLMIDYDHASLASVSLDPATAGKAAGWFGLEVRGGELWAVNVRWTPPAAAALSAKEWRFMSPAFSTDEDGRITSLLNVAITNLPATRQLQPLMAASKRVLTMAASDSGLNPKLVSSALEAVAGKDAKGALGVLQQILAALLGGAPSEDAPPPAGDGGADGATEMAVGAAPPPDEKKVAASAIRLMALTGAKSFGDAVDTVATYRASHIELETERTKLATERAVLESAERRRLAVELVTCGAEFPSTVWADDKATTLKPRWTKMDLVELRAHVADQRAARGGKARPAPVTPSDNSGAPASHGLSSEELAVCASMGADPASFAFLKSQRDGVKAEGV